MPKKPPVTPSKKPPKDDGGAEPPSDDAKKPPSGETSSDASKSSTDAGGDGASQGGPAADGGDKGGEGADFIKDRVNAQKKGAIPEGGGPGSGQAGKKRGPYKPRGSADADSGDAGPKRRRPADDKEKDNPKLREMSAQAIAHATIGFSAGLFGETFEDGATGMKDSEMLTSGWVYYFEMYGIRYIPGWLLLLLVYMAYFSARLGKRDNRDAIKERFSNLKRWMKGSPKIIDVDPAKPAADAQHQEAA